MSRIHNIQLVGGLFLAVAVNAEACGPWFPNRLLENGDRAVLQAPTATFQKEIERIMPRATNTFGTVWMSGLNEKSYRSMIKSLDVQQFQELIKRPDNTISAEQIESYKAVREAIYNYDLALAEWDWVQWGKAVKSDPPRFIAPPVPEGNGIPPEFSQYLKGAVLWYQGQTNPAVKAWEGLLNLPADQRQYRSTWAAFMIGMAMLKQGEQAQAIGWFQGVRSLARSGFRDSLGLAASSLGWEARAELDRKNHGRAIELYLDQLALGDPTALNSLRFAAGDAWRLSPKRLIKLVGNAAARKVLVAYALSYNQYHGPSSEIRKAFLSAVEQAKIPVVDEADRLAWAAYQAGDMDLAERFNAVAPRDSMINALLRAKLLLRKGEEGKAMAQLAAIVRNYPESPLLHSRSWDWYSTSTVWDLDNEPLGGRLRGELGVLCLSRREFVQALDLLLRGGYWQDAAYVAERVLTTAELAKYVDANWTVADFAAVEKSLKAPYLGDETRSKNENIRYLLGRKFIRDGNLEKAQAYLPPSLRPVLDIYTKHINAGNNEKAPQGQQAEDLWKAACIARYLGMELMGTEMDPDWAVYRGKYEEDRLAKTRAKPNFARLVKSSPGEMERAKRNAPVPDTRFHYRDIAANLAWRAALLMPDESDRTAEVLCTAGGWLKEKEPQRADRFYQALVKRCGKTTELGRQADLLHWFPKRDVDREALLRKAME